MTELYSYDEIFKRNIGVFTQEEQNKLKGLRIAIAGAGGLGGPVAYNLARLGVGTIHLADPDKFDATNINRQFGAYVDTIGEYKTDAIAKELRRINPYLEVKTWNRGIDEHNIDEFLQDTDIVIDALDFFMIEIDLLLHSKCREKNIWMFTGQGAAEIFTFTSFDPKGISLADKINPGNPDIKALVAVFFPRLPKIATKGALNNLKFGSEVHISSHATIQPIGGAIVTEQMLNKIVFGRDFAIFPKVKFLDLSIPEFGEN
jgi:tRNA A37 threonylcarbamoyladenosine dehydratase